MILIISKKWELGGCDLTSSFNVVGLRQMERVNFPEFMKKNWPQITLLVVDQESVRECQSFFSGDLIRWRAEGKIPQYVKIVVISSQKSPDFSILHWQKIIVWRDFKTAHELAEKIKSLEEKNG